MRTSLGRHACLLSLRTLAWSLKFSELYEYALVNDANQPGLKRPNEPILTRKRPATLKQSLPRVHTHLRVGT